MAYQPKFGRVLIEREVKKASGIIIPEGAAKRNAPSVGTIVALGETAGWTDSYNDQGEITPTQTLKIGDKVLFGKHAGAWIDDQDVLFICQDADILAVIKE